LLKTKRVILFVSAFVAALNGSLAFVHAQKPFNIEELEPFIKVEKLSDRLVIIKNSLSYNETVSAIATPKGIVVIDAGFNPKLTEKYKQRIEKEFKRNDFIYLINTHPHPDHVFGNRAFSGVAVIGHANAKEQITAAYEQNFYNTVYGDWLKQQSEKLKTADPHSTEAKAIAYDIHKISEMLSSLRNNFVLPIPTIMFNDRMTLNMGDVTFELFYFGEAHTQSDILVYVPEEKILFVGDLFYASGDVIFKAIDKTKIDKWYAVLNTVLQPGNEIRYVVSGHSDATLTKDVLMVFYGKVKALWEGYNKVK
jgi:glyoxylase-like metal-dependent hydrolase (beta-lactamase superfamily II)